MPPVDPITGLPLGTNGFMGAINPLNQPMNPQLIGQDYSYGKPVPLDVSALGSQISNQQNLLDLLRDPFLGASASIMTGDPTAFNWAAFQPQNQFLGGGGGGGGYYDDSGNYVSTGGGMPDPFEPTIWTTPTMDAMRNSADPIMKTVYGDISAGTDPVTIKQKMYQAWNSGAVDPVTGQPMQPPTPEMQDMYFGTVDKMFEEKAGFDRTQLENQQGQQTWQQQASMAQAEPNQLQEYWNQWGLPTPDVSYGPQGPGQEAIWPTDLQPQINQFLPSMQPRMNQLQRRMNRIGSQVQYRTPEAQGPAPGPVSPERMARLHPGGQTVPTTTEEVAETPRNYAPWTAKPGDAPVIYSGPVGRAASSGPVGQQQTAAPPEPQVALSGITRNAMEQGQAQRAAELWQRPTSEPMGWEEITRNGNQFLANPAAQQYGQLEQRLQNVGQRQETSQNQFNTMVGNYLQQQGRTPQRDALSTRLNYLRSMGLQI